MELDHRPQPPPIADRRSFVKYTPEQFSIAENIFQTYTIGACSRVCIQRTVRHHYGPDQPVGLDAGKLINVNWSERRQAITAGHPTPRVPIPPRWAAGRAPTILPLYLDQGTYSIDNGAGGADVKGFKFSLTVPPPLTWTNMNSVGPVIRANGQLVTWTGGDPNGIVTITGDSIQC